MKACCYKMSSKHKGKQQEEKRDKRATNQTENNEQNKEKQTKNPKEASEGFFALCENTVRRWPSENQELSSHQTPNLLAL